MRITKTQRIHAIVDQEIEYEVNEEQYHALIADGMSAEDALEEMRSNGNVEVISNKAEVDECLEVHECEVE